eukprot:TRINITY_DN69336_c0_g1_i1.p1 TRINITY_DN69336_c0_g1~~TRINITY_DN69336_c0_g1_i1.p1  ORF type:complete len:739 (+),score=100.05 TRINITY_DN69336_c0_g1_i1:289-2217(+)
MVVSTTGQGDPPVNMRRFWHSLLPASLPQSLFKGLHFTVFGLGDTHYREFNYASRKLFARLKGLGAEPFFRIGLGDDQHDFGQEQELDPWAEGMWAALTDLFPSQALAAGAKESIDTFNAADLRYEVEELPELPLSEGHDVTKEMCSLSTNPDNFEVEIVGNRSLCSEAHAAAEQDVISVRLAMPQGMESYKAGDVCSVWPRTDPEQVRRFVVETLGLKLNLRVRVRPTRRDGQDTTTTPFPETPLTLEEIFTSYVDISAVPSRYFFHVLSFYTDHELHSQKLREFGSRTLEAKDALYEYCKREKRSAAECMWDFWTARPPLAVLLSILPLMRPRRYSIASSPNWYADGDSAGVALDMAARFWLDYCRARQPLLGLRLESQAALSACSRIIASARRTKLCVNEKDAIGGNGHSRHDSKGVREGNEGNIERRGRFDLCVAVVKFTTKTGREGAGLCSTFLKKAPLGTYVRCGIESGALSLPSLDVPLIFVCPGTGLSPCRALVQERHLELAQGLQTNSTKRFEAGMRDMMFLGFRHEAGDFLYGEEWKVYSAWLDVQIAFSRDHEDRKVYVQEVIEEHGARVCALLDAGARIFVCGRAHPMPSQVFDAFAEVLQIHRGLSSDASVARLRQMQRTERYICDTWG